MGAVHQAGANRTPPRRMRQGVVNRDIKLENTLLDSSPRPLVKICDFGYSKVCWVGSRKRRQGQSSRAGSIPPG